MPSLFIFSYYNWAVAGPYLMSFMAFDKPLQPVRFGIMGATFFEGNFATFPTSPTV